MSRPTCATRAGVRDAEQGQEDRPTDDRLADSVATPELAPGCALNAARTAEQESHASGVRHRWACPASRSGVLGPNRGLRDGLPSAGVVSRGNALPVLDHPLAYGSLRAALIQPRSGRSHSLGFASKVGRLPSERRSAALLRAAVRGRAAPHLAEVRACGGSASPSLNQAGRASSEPPVHPARDREEKAAEGGRRDQTPSRRYKSRSRPISPP